MLKVASFFNEVVTEIEVSCHSIHIHIPAPHGPLLSPLTSLELTYTQLLLSPASTSRLRTDPHPLITGTQTHTGLCVLRERKWSHHWSSQWDSVDSAL